MNTQPKGSVLNTKILMIDFYRDCATAGVVALVERDNGTSETVEYLIHGHNFANGRIDVTRDGYRVQAYPSFRELEALQTALYDLDPSKDYYKGHHDAKVAVMLSGMVMAFMYWVSTNNPSDQKRFAPEAAEERKRKDPMAEAVDKMTAQLAEELEKSALSRFEIDTHAVDAAMNLKTIIEAAKKLGAENISLDLKLNLELEAPAKMIKLQGVVGR